MQKKNGFSLVELLIALMIMGILAAITTTIFVSGLQSYGTSVKYMAQHDTVLDVTQRIRKDIAEASAYGIKESTENPPDKDGFSAIVLEFPDSIGWKSWVFQKGTLSVKISTNPYTNTDFNTVISEKVVSGLDTDVDSVTTNDSTAYVRRTGLESSGGDTILLSIKPVAANTTIHQNRNVINPIITEFSVQYKTKIIP